MVILTTNQLAMVLPLPEWKNSPSPRRQPEVPRVSWYRLQLMAPLRWWTRPQATSPPNHHHYSPSQNTPLLPEHAALCWHHQTGWCLLIAHTRGLLRQYVAPLSHQPVSLCQPNSSSKYKLMYPVSIRLKEMEIAVKQKKTFFKYQCVYTLASILQVLI